MGKKTAAKPAAKPAAKAKPAAAAGKDNLDEKSRDVKGKIIEDFGKFKAEWEKKSNDPAQSVLFFLIGLYNYAKGNEKAGEAMATAVLAEKMVNPDKGSPSGFKIAISDKKIFDNFATLPGVVNSYLGGTLDNGYEIDPDNIVMHVESAGYSGNDGSVHIKSSGKDFTTPFNVIKDAKGQWRVTDYYSAATGVKQPE
jgi:hypothetical protein